MTRMTRMLRYLAVVLTIALVGPLAILPAGFAPSAAAQENVELTMWVFGEPSPFLQQVSEEFTQSHPNVTLAFTEFPEDQYVTKVDTALAAGSPPDIAFVYEPRWLKADKFLPLDDVIAAEGIDLSTYNQGAVGDHCTFEGVIYCLGSSVGAVVLFYNKDMLDAAGVPYPSSTEPLTIDEYAAIAAQLSNQEEDLTAKVWGASAAVPFWWTDPRTHFSEDGRATEGYVNDEPTAHMYEVLGQMVRDGHAPSPSVLLNMGDDVNLFAQLQQAMAIGDFEELTTLETQGIRYGVAPVPVEQEGDLPWVPVWTDGWGVFADSPHPELAKEFLVFMSTRGQEIHLETDGEIPIDSRVAEELNWSQGIEGREEFLDVVQLARPGIFVAGFWDVTSPLGEMYNLIAEDQVPAQDALNDAVIDMEDFLARSWETWDSIE